METLNINIDDKYINELDNKHKEMRRYIENNFGSKQPLPSGGAYNKLFKIGDDIVIRQVDQTKCDEKSIKAKNGTFNSIFVPSLLKECGEDTIATGFMKLQNDEMLYMEKAEGSLWEQFSKIHNIKDNLDVNKIITTLNSKTMTDDEIQITLLTMILECFTTANFNAINNYRFNMAQVDQCDQDVLTKFLSEDNMKIIARHLCKVFLFQMFDRKPENLLVKKGETGKNLFVEADFDDIKEITCLFADIDQETNSGYNNYYWQNHLDSIHNNMYITFSSILSKVGKQEEWKNILDTTIQEYTITEEKIKNIISDIAIKNKYFGLPENELIQGIKDKLKLWKNMLITVINNKTSPCFIQFKTAIWDTRVAFQYFNEDGIKNIVKQAQGQQIDILNEKKEDQLNNKSAESGLETSFCDCKTCCPCLFNIM